MPEIILASESNARLKILQGAGLRPRVIVSGVDESAYPTCSPRELVSVLAEAKARRVGDVVSSGYVIGCDSVFSFEPGAEVGVTAFSKCESRQSAVALWKRLSGGEGYLLTGHYVLEAESGAGAGETNCTKVYFAKISSAQIEAYVNSGEPLEAAGGFAIDRLGGWFVESIEGDYTNVVGLSLPTLRRLFERLGRDVVELWEP